MPNNTFTATHIARSWSEEVVSWGPAIANMYKLWFDRSDHFESLLDNVHQQKNLAWFQAAGQFLAPDQMTLGQGRLTLGEARAEVYLYAALGAPMFLSCAPAALAASPELLALVRNPEVLAINADEDCVMASNVNAVAAWGGSERWAFDVWVKPLHDGALAFVVVNKDPLAAHNVSFAWGDGGDGEGADAFPVAFARASVRDAGAQLDVGVFDSRVPAFEVPPHDARIFRVTPVQ